MTTIMLSRPGLTQTQQPAWNAIWKGAVQTLRLLPCCRRSPNIPTPFYHLIIIFTWSSNQPIWWYEAWSTIWVLGIKPESTNILIASFAHCPC